MPPHEPAAPDPESRAIMSHSREIEAGLAAMRAGDLDLALAHFVTAHERARQLEDLEGQSAALRHQSFVWRQRSDWARAMSCANAAVKAAASAGVRDLLAEALNAQATIYQAQGEHERAMPILREAAAIGYDRRVQALILANMGAIEAEQGSLDSARRHFIESAERFRQAGYHFGEAVTLNNFGRAALDVGNARLAQPMLQEARAAARRAGDAELLGIVHSNLAEAHERLGELEEGTREASAALEIFTRLANHLRLAECLRVLGALAVARGDLPNARVHYGEALAAATIAKAAVERRRIETALAALPA